MTIALPLIGTILALVALGLGIAEVLVRDFVGVFVATNEEDTTSDEISNLVRIAGLGVYTTEYSTDDVSDYTLAASGIPDESFEQPTAEFKMIFPAQQGFLFEILPINSELVAGLSAINPALGGALSAPVAAVEAVEFDSCEQFIPEANTAMTNLFTVVNDGVVPQLVQLVINGENQVAQVAGGVQQISAAMGSADPAANPVMGLLVSSFDLALTLVELGAVPECLGINVPSLTSTLDAEVVTCVASTYGILSASQVVDAPALSGVLADLGQLLASDGCAGQPIANCFLSMSGAVDPTTSVFAPPVFTGGVVSICDTLVSLCNTNTTKTEYYLQVAGLLTEVINVPGFATLIGDDALASLVLATQGISLLAGSAAFLSPALEPTSADADLLEVLNSIALITSLPADFADFYLPCAFLQLTGGVADSLPSTPGDCKFVDFLFGAGEIATNDANALGPTISQLGSLYEACREFTNPSDCENVFPGLFLHLSYLSGLDLTDFLTIEEQAIAACNDDETDVEHIERAQLFAALGVGGYGVCSLFGILILVCKLQKSVFLFVTGTLLMASGAINLGALLEVQNAPIYDGVGGDPVLFDTVFESGDVVLYALASVGAAIFGGFAFLIGGARQAFCAAQRKPSVVEKKQVDLGEEDQMPPEMVAVAERDGKTSANPMFDN